MSYLVLARKWRPKRFSELVGQEHVVRALGNALDTGRVHHAFLFTGTRGVGKTTIARIFAKSLNCEKGTSAEPCGVCAACTDIDAGRYIDLLEIDAASNTGVDDVREVIENAQYMPSRGQYKVYLIDEVHMLSKAAFNALLKTLEEPPGHVKFLLATTDPQKLPVTVLSRCLQFNLKRLDEEQIQGQITRILAAEEIGADAGAVRLLARAADGSLRDGLSLLDQAIAYAGGALDEGAVRTMLGSVDRTQVAALLDALAEGDGQRLLATIETVAGFAPDWGNVLEALAEALHRIQVRQLVPGASRDDEGLDVSGYAARLRPEVVQLWYQMAVNGRRDLELAPSPRIGFEMSVLRMLAFRPEADAGPIAGGGAGGGAAAGASGSAGGAGSRTGAVSAAGGEASAAGSRAAASPRASDVPVEAGAVVPGPVASGRIVSATAVPAPAVSASVMSEPVMPAPVAPRVAATPVEAAPARAAVAATDDPPPWDVPDARPASRAAVAPEMASAPPEPAPVRRAPASIDPDTPVAAMPSTGTAAPAAAAALAADIVMPSAAPSAPSASAAATGAVVADAEDWLRRVAACDLNGPARQLAAHIAFVGHADGVLTLALDPGFEYLRSERSVAALAEAMAASLGGVPTIAIQAGAAKAQTLHQRQASERDSRQSAAEDAFLNDPGVKRLIEQHGARVVPDSIRPLEEN